MVNGSNETTLSIAYITEIIEYSILEIYTKQHLSANRKI